MVGSANYKMDKLGEFLSVFLRHHYQCWPIKLPRSIRPASAFHWGVVVWPTHARGNSRSVRTDDARAGGDRETWLLPLDAAKSSPFKLRDLHWPARNSSPNDLRELGRTALAPPRN